jgi:hypothetical protein
MMMTQMTLSPELRVIYTKRSHLWSVAFATLKLNCDLTAPRESTSLCNLKLKRGNTILKRERRHLEIPQKSRPFIPWSEEATKKADKQSDASPFWQQRILFSALDIASQQAPGESTHHILLAAHIAEASRVSRKQIGSPDSSTHPKAHPPVRRVGNRSGLLDCRKVGSNKTSLSWLFPSDTPSRRHTQLAAPPQQA